MNRKNILFFTLFSLCSMPFTTIQTIEWKNWFNQGTQWTTQTIKNQWLGCTLGGAALGGCWYMYRIQQQDRQQLVHLQRDHEQLMRLQQENNTIKEQLGTLTKKVISVSEETDRLTSKTTMLCARNYCNLNNRMNLFQHNLNTLDSKINFINKKQTVELNTFKEDFNFYKSVTDKKIEGTREFEKWLKFFDDHQKPEDLNTPS